MKERILKVSLSCNKDGQLWPVYDKRIFMEYHPFAVIPVTIESIKEYFSKNNENLNLVLTIEDETDKFYCSNTKE